MRRSALPSRCRSTCAMASPPAFRPRSAPIPCARSPTATAAPPISCGRGMCSRHTEACVDLCRLAGLPPVGVLAELMNDDGTVMRGPAVSAFAEQHRLKRISIADLIAYRQVRDKLVKRIGEFPVESEIGTLAGYAYVTPFDAIQHMAFVHGRIGDGKGILPRLHRADIAADADQVYGRAELIVKVKEPLAAERRELKRGQILFTYLHLAPDRQQTEELLAAGVTAIAYETVTSPQGSLPLLTPMSEVAG